MGSPATKPAIDPVAVLQMMADGLKYRDVASDLGTTYAYLKQRMHHYYNDTGSTNMVHAIAQAFRAGKIK